MKKLWLMSICTFFLGASFVHAVSDNFSIRQQYGEDTEPPTTPTLLSAIPVSTSQIDLEWTVSTDDFGLGGYKVFRDDVQVATTTLFTYSDTGLSASTTYSYFIQAFDIVQNISSSSNSIATTTFPLTATSTPPEEEGDSGSGVPERLTLISLEVVPATNSVEVSWKTNRYAQFELRWGKTASYELGFVINELYKRGHTSLITDLEPGTRYEYQLIGYDRNGRQVILASKNFKTLQLPDDVPPSNVSNLHAEVRGNDIVLNWDNPMESDFSHVRIVRSHLFYPTDPYNGVIAYQGSGHSFVDRGAAQEGIVQYYTVYSYDTEGNISSGAVVRVIFETVKERGDIPQTLALTFSDIELVQSGQVITSDDIDADLPLTLRIAYDMLPEHLKSIIITLTHPQESGTSFSFLLRVNGDKTYYQATLAPLREAGLYPTVVSIYDYEQAVVHELRGTFQVWRKDAEETFLGVPLTVRTQDLVERSSFFWLFLLLLLLLWLLRLTHTLVSHKHTAGVPEMVRLAALVLCVGGISASSFIIFVSFARVSNTALLSNSFTGGALPLDTISGFATAVIILLLAGVCAFILTLFFRRAKR